MNYGGLLLQALLEHWPKPYNTEDESDAEQGCNMFFKQFTNYYL